jgi:hypothetical protein
LLWRRGWRGLESGYRFDGAGVIADVFPHHSEVSSPFRPAKSDGTTRGITRDGWVCWVSDDLFDLVLSDAVPGDVSHVSVWVILQIPDDEWLEHSGPSRIVSEPPPD